MEIKSTLEENKNVNFGRKKKKGGGELINVVHLRQATATSLISPGIIF